MTGFKALITCPAKGRDPTPRISEHGIALALDHSAQGPFEIGFQRNQLGLELPAFLF